MHPVRLHASPDSVRRRRAVGDKGKKSKDKGQKQRIREHEAKAKEKLAKQVKKTP